MGEIIFQFGDEILKRIDEFENYAVSNKGYIYRGIKYGLLPESYKKFRLKTYKDKNGFLKVQLSSNGKRKVFYIHRLVAKYFVPNKKGCKYVTHINGNREDNSSNNLKWVSSNKSKKCMNQKGKKDILSISISPEIKKRLKEKAEEKGLTVSSLIEKIIINYLEGSDG